MISGIEKMVIDAEAIASAQRLIQGIQPQEDSLALATRCRGNANRS